MKYISSFVFTIAALLSFGQSDLFNQDITYSRQDTLRGSVTEERAWWDLKHYELSVDVDIENKSISGKNIVTYQVLEPGSVLQIDLQDPMKITRVTQGGKDLEVTKEGNAHFIQLRNTQEQGSVEKLSVEFEGTPRIAVNAPWDGGFSWSKDSNGKPFVANSNQGLGASVWWPCKDHGYDEPEDGLLLTISVPNDLVAVGNGRLIDKKVKGDKAIFTWKVINPINNYGVNVNIGDYVNFSEVYEGEKGNLDMDYWVLIENLKKAKDQFKDAKRTIEAFEYWFGPYPFYEDSYKLVEVPYLGMEHQSSVTYGNSYKNGYNGRGRGSFDWSGTGWGLKWDYIIVHETGHEWFANNITSKDIADMWIHESFTSYSETLFTEYHFGKSAGDEYVVGTRRVIANQSPIIGDYDVNKEGSSDMYFKGNNILHTLRQIINDDDKWRSILRGLNEEFYHRTVTTQQVENYIAQQAEMDLTKFFDQYLRNASIPRLEYKSANGKTSYRWADVIENFEMPLDVKIEGEVRRLNVTTEWNEVAGTALEVDVNYYINYSPN